jgi:hypothetical protein
MFRHLWIPVTVAVLGISAFAASQTFAAAGSGQSADNRNNDYVVICHYDRNQGGPNAGPHTITISVNALDRHLENHVKDEGFTGDDHVGACKKQDPPKEDPKNPDPKK